MKLPIKRLSYSRIGELADEFLTSFYPSLKLPIPIELIAEKGFGIEIVPVMNMKSDYDTDACLASSLRTIFIDYNCYLRYENRAKFSIAHEIAHVVLHSDIFESLEIKAEKDILKLSQNISEEDYSWLEFQAYAFAGHVLVPSKLLVAEYKKRLVVQVKDKSFEEVVPVFHELLDLFQVSGEVMLRRLQKEGLIQING